MNPNSQFTLPPDLIPATISSALSTACTPTTLGAVMHDIKTDIYAEKIAAVRAADGTAEGKALKKALPGFLLGEFSVRNKDGLVTPAGVVALDIDGIGVEAVEALRAQIGHDPHLAFFFASARGTGCKVAFAVDPARLHLDSWNAARIYFESKYEHGSKIDPACKDTARLIFVSDDPLALIAPGPVARISYPVAAAAEAVCDLPAPAVAAQPPENVAELLHFIPPRPSYDQWIRVIAGVGAALPDDDDEAISLLRGWSPAEVEGEYQDKLDHRLQDVGFGSLVRTAKENGWRPSEAYKSREAAAILQAGKSALLEKLSKCEFGVGEPPKKPVPRLRIGTICVSTSGNLMTITAQAKSGKSAVIGALVASVMVAEKNEQILVGEIPPCAGEDTENQTQTTLVGDCLGFVAAPPNSRAVLHLDTEQSPFDHHAGMTRALARAGVDHCPTWLHSYHVAGSSPGELRRALHALVEREATKNGLFAVVIDGVADLCSDVNDAAEGNAIVAELHAMAIKYDCPVVTVIHENPTQATGKMRGHLGSQLERKAETNLRLTRDGEITVVHADKNRGAPITEKFGPRFAWNTEAGGHLSVASAFQSKAEQKTQELRELAEEVFGDAQGLKYAPLVAAIVEARGCSPKTAERKFGEMKKTGVVHRDDPSGFWMITPA